MESLVRDELRATVDVREWMFCASPGCDVVYFAEQTRSYRLADLAVRVGLKERSGHRPICYCFGHSIESIAEEIARTGRSTASARIAQQIQEVGCRCKTTNPRGRCCMADIRGIESALCSRQASEAD